MSGQLGVGDTANRLGFTQVDAGQLGGARIVMAACGWLHSVVVSAEGRVWTFGAMECTAVWASTTSKTGWCLTLLAAEVFEGSKIVTVAAGGLPHHGRGSEREALGVGRGILRPAGPGRHQQQAGADAGGGRGGVWGVPGAHGCLRTATTHWR